MDINITPDHVIQVIQYSAAVWVGWLIIDIWAAWRHIREVRDAQAIESLRDDLNGHLAGTSTETSASVLERFYDATGVDGGGPIGRHLAAILEAGWNNTKLDVAALIALSTQQLFRTTTFLQSMLGVFLVLGLFGTLRGLAAELPRIDLMIGRGANDIEGRDELLGVVVEGLGGAFLPSLWGVGVTAVGIVVMALRGRVVTSVLQQRLEAATLMVWVPAFLPNAPQQLDRVLQQIAVQVRTSGATVKDVDELTTRLQARSSEWLGIVEVATAQMKEMGATAERFATATATFGDGVTRFETVQDTLTDHVREFSTENAAMHAWLKEETSRAAATQVSMLETMADQRATLTAAFQSLKTYETEYISQRSAIDEAMRKSLEATAHVLETSESQATRVITELATPLKDSLGEDLNKLNRATSAGLATISQDLQRIGQPLSDAAKELDNVLHQMERQFAASNKAIADEFRQQNRAVTDQNAEMATQTEQLVTQTEQLVTQRETLDQLLTATNKLVADQASQWQKLLDAIEKLSKQLQRVTVVGPLKAVMDAFKSRSSGRPGPKGK